MIRLGNYVNVPGQEAQILIRCDDERLQRHLDRPWFRAYLEHHLSCPLGGNNQRSDGEASVPETAWERHAVWVGSTGSGKTRVLLHILTEMFRAGCSVVVLDPKGETVELLLAQAIQAGFPAEQTILLDPRHSDGIPGCNPLAVGLPLLQAVGDVHAVLERSSASWGPRLSDMLLNALIVIGAHRLSLYELVRILLQEEYREQLLARSIQVTEQIAYEEARLYFQEEFAAWGRAERASAVSPVLNKVREPLRSSFLRPLLCARENTLQLERLWRQPHLLLIRLDRTALGEEGARLLAGLLTQLLFRTALRASGPVPVALAIDELPFLERFVSETLGEIVTVARSQRLRCLLACQHLEQVSDRLRATLLANCGVQGFLRLGHTDARLVATSLAVGTERQVSRLQVRVDREDRETGEPETVSWRHPIRDAYGRALRLTPAAWQEYCGRHRRAALSGPKGLERVRAGRRLYVQAADTGEPIELRKYVAGLRPGEYRIEGPALHLLVSFPRPRLSEVERRSEADAVRCWTHTLQDLPIQHGVIRVPGQPPETVRFVNVPSPQVSQTERERFLAVSRKNNGHSAAQIAADLRWRRDQVEWVASGRGHSIVGSAAGKEQEDGSLF